MTAFAEVVREDGGKIYEITSSQDVSYTAPASIAVAGNLLQFMCVVINASVNWVLINRTKN
jgi:hypothetical protein